MQKQHISSKIFKEKIDSIVPKGFFCKYDKKAKVSHFYKKIFRTMHILKCFAKGRPITKIEHGDYDDGDFACCIREAVVILYEIGINKDIKSFVEWVNKGCEEKNAMFRIHNSGKIVNVHDVVKMEFIGQ